MLRLLVLAWVLASAAPAAGQDDSEAAVRSILQRRCSACHGEVVQRKSLRLDSAAGVRAGGRSGAVVMPGDPDRSLLVQHVRGAGGRRRMPAEGEPLPAAEVSVLERWIAAGAPGLDAEPSVRPAPHWAYRRVARPAVPRLDGVSHPIDAFVAARLRQTGLALAPQAEPATLLRRVSLDLTGLPPTPAQARAFLEDHEPGAYERLVDRLLASPRYGERWAALWLDLARYADTKGYEADRRRSIWRWRDWVIQALDADLPFDRFTEQQLAGDLLPPPGDEQAAAEQLVATAFHRNTMNNDEGGTDDEEFRCAAVVDRVNTTLQVWMGTTIGCAQCHDHKYDPFSQRDYYRLFAFFDQTEDCDRPDEAPVLRAPTPEQRRELRDLAARRTELWRALEGPRGRAMTYAVPAPIRGTQRFPALVEARVELAPELQPLRDELRAVEARLAALPVPTVPILRELPVSQRRRTHLHVRGSFLSKGEAVEPGLPEVFGGWPAGLPANRLGLARWLVSRDNPLTARVLANRLWEQLFGRGLVETSGDFGTQGEPPTHPELLDWLASELVEGGWSLKAILRTIVTSATYRQSSAATAESLARDPDNRWLARGPRFRLPAEMLRDQALQVSGLLSSKMLGPSVMPPQPDGIWINIYSDDRWTESQGEDRYRRALYTFWRRTAPYPALETFDAPSREVCVVRRLPSNTPLQALVTLNDPAFVEAAGALARRALDATADAEGRAAWLVGACLVRGAEPREIRILTELAQRQGEHYAARPAQARDLVGAARQAVTDDAVDLAAWIVVANVVLNLDEFLVKG